MRVFSTHYRTIWPEDNGRVVKIIDQRALPHRFLIEDLVRPEDFNVAIRDMHVRGAGLIGATAGFAMAAIAAAASDAAFDRDVAARMEQLLATRPTAKNLSWAVRRTLVVMEKAATPRTKRLAVFHEACAIADEDALFCKKIGQYGVELLRAIHEKTGKVVNILTHCNAGWLAFVDYGSATAPIYQARREGIPVHVWVDETRPWNQGARLTAWELGQEGVPHTLIADNTGGHLMQHNMVDLVITGADRVTGSGDVANKIGTYLKALAARDCNVPFYVALPSSTFDWEIDDGITRIPIEERPGDEITRVHGLDPDGKQTWVEIAPPGTPTANYSFDVTPARLVTGLITERGITAPTREKILSLFPEHANTSDSLKEIL